jgi:hypothetical protein
MKKVSTSRMKRLELAVAKGVAPRKENLTGRFFKDCGGVLLEGDNKTVYYLGDEKISHEEYLHLNCQ